ncbi:hypothetical protein PGT21_008036 [Puccinia graminis f. sp. tritici]|uniref:Uncharacterized protein n=1 Tax=Puccinia graminis f. sp. tritici TaxID=56615 RepID=A0A5B0QAS5_PUCGR|nr:hypothetical protein PGT21_008036 [Puccinia graminis f. sp. tritici]
MAAQPTTNNNKTSPPNNNPTLAQANQLNPPAASNPGTTTTAPTTPVPPQFNLTECSKYLFSLVLHNMIQFLNGQSWFLDDGTSAFFGKLQMIRLTGHRGYRLEKRGL